MPGTSGNNERKEYISKYNIFRTMAEETVIFFCFIFAAYLMRQSMKDGHIDNSAMECFFVRLEIEIY